MLDQHTQPKIVLTEYTQNKAEGTIGGLPFYIDKNGKPGRIQHAQMDTQSFRLHSFYLDRYAFMCELVKSNDLAHLVKAILAGDVK